LEITSGEKINLLPTIYSPRNLGKDGSAEEEGENQAVQSQMSEK